MTALAKFLKEKDVLTLGITGSADRQMDGAAIAGHSSEKKTPGDDTASTEEEQGDRVPPGQGVTDEQLEGLAQRRAENVSAYLVDQANIDAKRIQFKPVQIKPAPDGEKGLVELSLFAN